MTHETAVSTMPNYVSGAPFRLYGDTPPPALTPRRQALDYGVQIVGELFSGCRYTWQFPADGFVAPDLFTEHLGHFYAGIATKQCPPSLLAKIENATLYQSVIRCTSNDGEALLYETHRPSDHAAATIPNARHLAETDRERFAGKDWQNLYVGSVGSPNYGHWLIDDMPRLKAALHLKAMDPRPVRILLHEFYLPIDQVRIDTIRTMLGADVEIAWLDFARAYHFDELYYATPVSDHPVQKSPLALAYAARRMVELALPDPRQDGRGDRLFVSRASSRSRTMVNQQDVRDLVRARGFRIVDPETMGIIEQVRLFAGAHTVIGQMGAAMTNTLFCPATTSILYLAPNGWIEPFYWDLAAVRGHRYRVLYGDVTDTESAPHESAFTVSLPLLSSVIDTL